MKRNLIIIIMLCIVLSIPSLVGADHTKPDLTIILVIDQFAAHYLPKLSQHLTHGIKFLMNNSIFYKNAYYPHAVPSTGPGHANLSAGITSDYTGITANSWCNNLGKKIACDDDDSTTAAVINPLGGVYNYGKGPANIMVDTISDQFILASEPERPHRVYSIALKSRSAICTANKMGKAIWLDTSNGHFTSSKAYFETLPNWLVNFNQKTNLQKASQVRWPLYYPEHSSAYHFAQINNYQWSSLPSIVGKVLPIHWHQNDPLEMFERTPAANQLLLDCALECIYHHSNKNSSQKLLLWVCLSPLDRVGHDYGPYSKEVIDMIYHLDHQIGRFIQRVAEHFPLEKTLFVLSADHGVSPIPELLNELGYPRAKRIHYKKIIQSINNSLAKKFGITGLIHSCMSGQIFLNEQLFGTLDLEIQKNVLDHIKAALSSQPGIKRIWTKQELKSIWPAADQIESFYKRQMFPGRTGRFIIQPYTYCIPDDYGTGTGHRTPYEADTHVPLMMYQKNQLERQTVNQKVWTLQLANSLAFILGIQKPSASTYNILPKINKALRPQKKKIL